MSFVLKRSDLHKPVAAWYSDYLLSDKWVEFKRRIALDRGKKCEVCKKVPWFSLHHKTYARLFNELPTDVLLVCKDCHVLLHQDKIPYVWLIYEPSLKLVKEVLDEFQKATKEEGKQTTWDSNSQKTT